MPEQIPVRESNDPEMKFASFFSIVAVTLARKAGVETPPGSPMNVSLTINGVEVPFVETVNNIFGRMKNDIDKEVQQRAEEMLGMHKDGISAALRENFESTMEQLSEIMSESEKAAKQIVADFANAHKAANPKP